MKSHLLVFFHDFLCIRILECSFGLQFVNKSGLKLTQRLLLHSNLRDLFKNKKDKKKKKQILSVENREKRGGKSPGHTLELVDPARQPWLTLSLTSASIHAMVN